MTPDDVAWLASPEATPIIEDTRTALASGIPVLAVLDRLRSHLEPARARAVLALLEGREAARAKFADTDRLVLDRESAEQATAAPISEHIAQRFEGAARIADLGCGAGADSLALARHAPVLAVDRDPARLAMLRANAAVRGLHDRIETLETDVTTLELPAGIDAVWIDPGRRDDRGRVLDPRRWTPPLEVALHLARRVQRAGIKVAPGIEYDHVPADAEIEFISRDGALGVAVLWLGAAVTAQRRATVLPANASLAASEDEPAAEVHPPGAYLYDPDPAIGRARLVGVLARDLAAWRLDPTIAYIASHEARDTPFARRFLIERWLPFAERTLREELRALGAARVEVMRRGSPVDTNALERRLNRALGTNGAGPVLTVALTRAQGQHIAIICERDR